MINSWTKLESIWIGNKGKIPSKIMKMKSAIIAPLGTKLISSRHYFRRKINSNWLSGIPSCCSEDENPLLLFITIVSQYSTCPTSAQKCLLWTHVHKMT